MQAIKNRATGDTTFWAFPFINAHAFLSKNGAITDLGFLATP